MMVRRASFVVGFVGLVGGLALSSSPAEASKASVTAATPAPADALESVLPEPERDPIARDSVAQQTNTSCGGIKHACGINGIYVCCDKETECCRRKNRRTVCEHKKDSKPC